MINLTQFYTYLTSDYGAYLKTSRSKKNRSQARKALKKLEAARQYFSVPPIGILEHPDIFHRCLCAAGYSNLETVLYGHTRGPLKPLRFPNQADYEKIFKELNDDYGYLPNNAYEVARFRELFETLLIASLATQVNFLKDCEDLTAASNTKILMAHIYNLRSLGSNLTNKAMFQLIMEDIESQPVMINPAQDLVPISRTEDIQGWRALLNTPHRCTVITLYDLAPRLESVLKRAPASIPELLQAAATLKYPSANFSMPLAQACVALGLDDATFETYRTHARKTQDLLPPANIDGASLGCADYYLVKLSPKDPLNDMLHKMFNPEVQKTRYLPDRSESSPLISKGDKDRISLETTCAYAVVRAYDRDRPAPVEERSGVINTQDYELLAFCDAWLTQEGNVTLEPWQFKFPSRIENVNATQALTQAFAAQVVSPKSPVYRVCQAVISAGNEEGEVVLPAELSRPEPQRSFYPVLGAKQYVLLKDNAEEAQALVQGTVDCLQGLVPASILSRVMQPKAVLGQNNSYHQRQKVAYLRAVLTSPAFKLFLQKNPDRQEAVLKTLVEVPISSEDGVTLLALENLGIHTYRFLPHLNASPEGVANLERVRQVQASNVTMARLSLLRSKDSLNLLNSLDLNDFLLCLSKVNFKVLNQISRLPYADFFSRTQS